MSWGWIKSVPKWTSYVTSNLRTAPHKKPLHEALLSTFLSKFQGFIQFFFFLTLFFGKKTTYTCKDTDFQAQSKTTAYITPRYMLQTTAKI